MGAPLACSLFEGICDDCKDDDDDNKCICFGMKELNTFLKHVYVVAGQISRFGFNLSSDRLYVPNFFL